MAALLIDLNVDKYSRNEEFILKNLFSIPNYWLFEEIFTHLLD